ncbi:Transcription factor IIIB 90 kDa subunit [Strongyloides ratti]|uniref:B-related factor 1 n=1 Tax=Strongyloides ratti TaxID=34506 RepID=A0A090KZK4_STRRB|nr:Transcription factor IIIB 90 kDa subunit [Strongyloides ratti]CEF62856.1 Transcription factor IIIB 90 kDa subunit [Strongyloides ratti]
MVRTCHHCGSSEIDEDTSRGDTTCMNCGTVLEESIVVSDVQFEERAGISSLVGQFVSRDRAQPNSLSGIPGLGGQESREQTYLRGKKIIDEIASQLRINQMQGDMAYNFYKMCVNRNFTRGRVRSHVVAACLYMACRLQNTAHLLLDFSDVTQVNVFDLGRTLNFVARSLKINLPVTDPCLYVLRFAVLLEFGDKQKEVVSLATRIVQRMKMDWIDTGRRPTGLCGAALLLAARSYNFNRSVSDVVRVVHVSESVVRKRLEEFSNTPSSMLTIEQFSNVNLSECEDPPAFQKKVKQELEELRTKEEEFIMNIKPELNAVERELETALEKKRIEKFRKSKWAKELSGNVVGLGEDTAIAKSLIGEEIVDYVFKESKSEYEKPSKSEITDDDNTYAQNWPTLEQMGVGRIPSRSNIDEEISQQEWNEDEYENENEEEDTLSDIDDDEIEKYILSPKERALKEKLWLKANSHHLEEMERRAKLKREMEEKGDEEKTEKKKRKPPKKKAKIEADTATEAMQMVIQEKKLSKKINYDVLKEIGLLDD